MCVCVCVRVRVWGLCFSAKQELLRSQVRKVVRSINKQKNPQQNQLGSFVAVIDPSQFYSGHQFKGQNSQHPSVRDSIGNREKEKERRTDKEREGGSGKKSATTSTTFAVRRFHLDRPCHLK